MSSTLKKYITIKKKIDVRKTTKYSLSSYFKCMKIARTKLAFTEAMPRLITVFIAPKSKREAPTVTTVNTSNTESTFTYVCSGMMWCSCLSCDMCSSLPDQIE